MPRMIATVACPSPLREIRLYGHLGQTFGRVHRLAVASVAEAVQALCVLLPGFERAFVGADGQAKYHVLVGQGKHRTAIDLAQAVDPVGAREAIRIVPAVVGAKSGLFTIILGAALIYFSGGLAAGLVSAGMSAGAAGMVGAVALSVGKTLVMGGIVQLLSPQRSQGASASATNDPSYAFDGPANTSQEGLPVPVAYGRVLVGGAVISSGLSTSDRASSVPAPAPAPAQPLPSEQPTNPVDAGGEGGTDGGNDGSDGNDGDSGGIGGPSGEA